MLILRCTTGTRFYRQKVVILLLLLVLFTSRAGAQQPTSYRSDGPSEQDVVLTLRITPDVKPETLALLNELTVPRVVRLEKNENAGKFLSSFYGASLTHVEKDIRDMNPWIGAAAFQTLNITKQSEIKLPAGPEYYANVLKVRDKNVDFAKQVSLETGTHSKGLVSQMRKLSDSLKNYFRNYCKTRQCTEDQKATLSAQRLIAFPYVSRYVSFTLNAEARSNAGTLVAQLRRDPAVVEAEIHAPARLVSPVSNGSLATLGSVCSLASDPEWFIRAVSLDQLPVDVLRGNAESILAIMDSGIDPDYQRFPLWKNFLEANGVAKEDDDQNGYGDDVVGCNFILQSDFPTDDQFSPEFHAHGTHVTGLASGLFLADPLLTAVRQRIQAMILKIADSNGFVDNGAVNDAIVYAQSKNAAVVNMSFRGSFSLSIKKHISQDENRIYVVAAGNGDVNHRGVNIDNPFNSAFPANLAKELKNVITVAAHGEDGRLACFSNFGPVSVDVAAPGVSINSTVTSGEFAQLNGTSQAAPLVSLAAALLHSQGLHEPALIKNRILVSVDFVPSYQNKLTSEGKLNIAKAVSIHNDVVELNDEKRTLLRGRLISPPATITVGEKTVAFGLIRKIINVTADDGSMIQQVVWQNSGKLERLKGKLVMETLTLRVGDTCLPLAPENIRDLIPAWRPSSPAVECQKD